MSPTIPDDAERYRIFAYLKRASSLTAWRYGLRMCTQFTQAYERVAKKAEGKTVMILGQPSVLLHPQELGFALRGQAAFVEAVKRLERGDRFCFRYAEALGHFFEGFRGYDCHMSMVQGHMMGHATFPIVESELYPELDEASQGIGYFANAHRVVLEPQYYEPAAVESASSLKDVPEYMHLPESGDVPTPSKEVLVHTKSRVPYHGIYEPVKFEMVRSMWRLFGQAATNENTVFEKQGWLNYLTAGSKAPPLRVDMGDVYTHTTNTVWRLIWKDERYVNGVVPEEESSYGYPID